MAEIHKQNLVIVNDCVETVRDRQDGSVTKPATDKFLHNTFTM
jgi:hypothetical protein